MALLEYRRILDPARVSQPRSSWIPPMGRLICVAISYHRENGNGIERFSAKFGEQINKCGKHLESMKVLSSRRFSKTVALLGPW